jgi:release factor glutamine methyltransferase
VTVAEVVHRSTEFLERKGVPSPRVDSEHLVAKALGLTRLDVYLHYDRPLVEAELDRIRSLVARRGTREPLAYILGEWGFR